MIINYKGKNAIELQEIELQEYVRTKYSDPEAVHHYETQVVKDSLERTSGVISFRMTGDLERALNLKQKLMLLDECRNGKSFARKVLHPASDLYGAVPAEVRDGLNIPDGLFQLMVGSWNIKELLDDLAQAFN